MRGTVQCLAYIMSFNPHNKSKDGDVIRIPIVFIRTMKHREVESSAQLNPSNKCWEQGFEPGWSDARSGTISYIMAYDLAERTAPRISPDEEMKAHKK